jgi:beta-galactosidase
MQRREFLKISLLAPLAGLALPELASGKEASGAEPVADGRPHRFTLSRQSFLLDGKPFQIRSGEMHPIRIPVEYWLHRIRMAKAMGLNTIAVYIMWNAFEQEPGVFDLKTGSRDFAHFIRLCQQEGMWVYLRPGPYVCAEWDFGGLPPYLLRDPNSQVRHKDDANYMAGVRRYLDAVAPVIKPLMANAGGPILMVQVENEYASFGNDLDYLKLLHSMWMERGIDGPFSISDGLGQIQKQQTYLPGTALGLDGDTDFASAQRMAGEAPVWVGEGYPGWLTHWGDPKLQSADYANTLNELLEQKRSFNLYVVHGGTNFGFGAGANADKDYSNFEPVITSYDYGAPINERGEATAAFHRFRELIARHVAHKIPAIPTPTPVITFDAATPLPYASIWDNLGAPRQVSHPQPNEILLAQDHGMVLYRKRLSAGGTLHIDGVRDYAAIFSDGRYLDAISRVRKPGVRDVSQIDVPAGELDILVDSFGHIGYGQAMADRKGIVGEVRLGDLSLEDWSVYGLPLNNAFVASLKPLAGPSRRPGLFFKLNMSLKTPGDTYIDMSGWDKGYVWVNGQLLGRYWHIGPQQRLYCPAPWLKAGANEIVVFDMHRVDAAPVRGVTRLAG